MDTNKMISDSLRIAKSLAPVDSGNLVHNAIRVVNRSSRGFTIQYSSLDAYYIKFVEEGTAKQSAQGFIKNTYLHLSEYFYNVGNNNTKSNEYKNDEAKSKLNMELYKDNPDYRRLIHRQSIFQHYQNENRNTLYRRIGE